MCVNKVIQGNFPLPSFLQSLNPQSCSYKVGGPWKQRWRLGAVVAAAELQRPLCKYKLCSQKLVLPQISNYSQPLASMGIPFLESPWMPKSMDNLIHSSGPLPDFWMRPKAASSCLEAFRTWPPWSSESLPNVTGRWLKLCLGGHLGPSSAASEPALS